ncbi:hypothetical protein ACIA49_37635 [Kribbella sp. NPDC051587]|uniref:hypothetical protein n=1 Tax=Kribbella sp. NPDC051587 TaxID=3364119 RepID=UPI0037872E9B
MSYQPPGGPAAPDYGRPPKKSRAGLFIVLMILLLVAVLGSFAFVATQVFTDLRAADPQLPPDTQPVAPTPKLTTPVKPKPVKPTRTRPVPTVPVKPVPITPLPPAPTGSAQLAAQFVARVNANDTKGATALACADTKQAIAPTMQTLVRRPAALTVSRASVTSGGGPIEVYALAGTMKGATTSGILVIEVATRPCVKSFAVH